MSELTAAELANVRKAVAFLRVRCGGMDALAKALRTSRNSVYRSPSPTIVFRMARLVSVPIDDILTGKFPTGDVCPHCGHRKGEESEVTEAAR